jgi:hypothetical protein
MFFLSVMASLVIFLVAATMPVILIAVAIQVEKAAVPIIYVAMKLEQELGLHKAPLAMIFAARWVLHLQPSEIDTTDASIWESVYSMRAGASLKSKPAYIMYAIVLAQVILFTIATFVYHVRLMR